MFLSTSIDMFLLLGTGLNLLLWFRFSEGDRLSSLFRKGFFISLILFIASMLYKYAGLSNHTGWLITAGQVFLLCFASMFIGLFKRLKVPLVVSTLVILVGLFFGKRLIDKYALNYVDIPEVSGDWEFLVKTENGDFPHDAHVVKEHNLTYQRAFMKGSNPDHELDDYFVVNAPTPCEPSILKIKNELEASKKFEVVEWNEQLTLDPEYQKEVVAKKMKSWANDPDISNQWYYDLLQIDEVHRYINFTNIKPEKTARLFILDSGVDAKHEDLKSNYLSYKSIYDKDSNGHGTHCAGIAGAVTNNNIGVASIVPSNTYVTITGIRVMSAFGIGSQRTIIKGILEAIDAGADVISMSLGGVSSDSKQQAYLEAFEYAYQNNTVVVVAAGNSNDEASRYTPANVDGVICVSAVDQSGKKAAYSNFVDEIGMPLSAPGTDVYSTMPNNKYAALSGTSMSTPMVSSIIALMKSINPQLTVQEIYGILKETGIDTNSEQMIGRLIQPYEAIKMTKSSDMVKSANPIPSILVNHQD